MQEGDVVSCLSVSARRVKNDSTEDYNLWFLRHFPRVRKTPCKDMFTNFKADLPSQFQPSLCVAQSPCEISLERSSKR